MFDLYKNIQVGDVTTYVRPYQTISLGPLGGPNSMVISEEKVVVLPDATSLSIPLSQDLQATITDPNESFDVVNPVTGEVTGTTTFAQLKIQMYSLYLHLASIRDSA